MRWEAADHDNMDKKGGKEEKPWEDGGKEIDNAEKDRREEYQCQQ